nr:hypothetical protein [uncultured bacterium]
MSLCPLCRAVYIIAGRTITADALRWPNGQRLIICNNIYSEDILGASSQQPS